MAVTANKLDQPKVVLDSFYKHQDEITRQTDMQARYIAKAIESAAFLLRQPDHHAAIVDAAAYIVRGVWHNRVVCGMADGEEFDNFWRLVMDYYKPRVEHMRVCRSETRPRAFTLEFKPLNCTEVYVFAVDP